MLSKLDIALLCDVRSVDPNGLAITPDRSRHGIHAQLGDGGAAATMPTLDALNGRMTFDGGDYMVLRAADDVDGVLAGMGGPHEETYIFYFDPYVYVAGDITFFFKGDLAGYFVRLRQESWVGTHFDMQIEGGPDEILAGTVDPVVYDGKQLMIAFIRRADVQEIWVDANLQDSGTDPTTDATTADDALIGCEPGVANPLLAGTGLRAMFYDGENAWTQTQLRALQRFLRGNL